MQIKSIVNTLSFKLGLLICFGHLTETGTKSSLHITFKLFYLFFYLRGASHSPDSIDLHEIKAIQSRHMPESILIKSHLSGKEKASRICRMMFFSTLFYFLWAASDTEMSTSYNGVMASNVETLGFLYPRMAISVVLKIQKRILLLI